VHELEFILIYTNGFKAKMMQRLSAPNAISVTKVSKEVGVSRSRLSHWLSVARTVVPMSKDPPVNHVVQTPSLARAGKESYAS
jgi:hypothetical protein